MRKASLYLLGLSIAQPLVRSQQCSFHCRLRWPLVLWFGPLRYSSAKYTTRVSLSST